MVVLKESNFSQSRIFFMDYLRAFAVILVVLAHSAIAYMQNLADFWYIYDSNVSILMDLTVFLVDKFVMVLLFFIAGFFSLYSLTKMDLLSYLRKRFIRIGIPLMIGIVFFNPVVTYISKVTKKNIVDDYASYWINDYFVEGIQLNYLWFLLVLLIFTVTLGFIYQYKKDIFNFTQSKDFSYKPMLFVFTICLIIYFISTIITSDYDWFYIGNTRLLQPTRMIFYVTFFCLGVYAYKNHWFISNFSKKKSLYWFVLAFISAVVLGLFYNFYYPDLLYSTPLKIINSFLVCILTIFSIIALVCLFKNFLNIPSKIGRMISDNSYSIYLLHYPFVVFFQYYLLSYDMFFLFKFIIVFIFSLVLSLFLSKYFLRRLPGLGVVF